MVFPLWYGWKQSHLHWVISNAAEAVHTPAERADGAASLLIINIHRLAAGGERRLPLVMVNACDHSLQDTAHLLENTHTDDWDFLKVHAFIYHV